METQPTSGSGWTAAATLLAPISWGTTYVTITELLPEGRPLFVAAMRVLPAGVVLLVAGAIAARWRPRGAEWWRTATLALFNFGIFLPLLVVAVYRLPGGVAAAVGGLQPVLVAALSWLVTGRRPRPLHLAVGAVAALGVGLVVLRPGAGLDPVGLLAAIGANLSFATGVVLTKQLSAPANRLASTGWQLLMGAAVLVPLSLVVEGAPPALTGRNVAGFAYLSLAGTALAFVLWFNGIRRLPAVAPPLLGLAAPVTGAVLGWALLGESLSPVQLTGFVVTIAAIAYGAALAGAAAHLSPHASSRGSFPSHRRFLAPRTGGDGGEGWSGLAGGLGVGSGPAVAVVDACSPVERVVPGTRGEGVVAVLTQEAVGSGAGDDRVRAVAASHGVGAGEVGE